MEQHFLLKSKSTVPYYTENWKGSQYLDVRIVCADGVCWAHKLALIHASPFVGSTLDDQFPGEGTTLILPDVTVQVMGIMLDLIYTGAADVPEGLIMESVEETMVFLQWLGGLKNFTKTGSQLMSQNQSQAMCTLDFLSPISFGHSLYQLEGNDKLLSDEEVSAIHSEIPAASIGTLEAPAATTSDEDIAGTVTSVVRIRPARVEVRDVAVQVPEPEAAKELPQATGPMDVEICPVSTKVLQETNPQMDAADVPDLPMGSPKAVENMFVDGNVEHDAQMSEDVEVPLDLSTEAIKLDFLTSVNLVPAAPVDILKDRNTVEEIQHTTSDVSKAAADNNNRKPRGRPAKSGSSRKKGILSRGVPVKGWFDSSQEVSQGQDKDFRIARKQKVALLVKRARNQNQNRSETKQSKLALTRATRLQVKSAVKSESFVSGESTSRRSNQVKSSAGTCDNDVPLKEATAEKQDVKVALPTAPMPIVTEETSHHFILDNFRVGIRSGHFEGSVSYISGHLFDGFPLPGDVITVLENIKPQKVWPYLKKLSDKLVVSVLLVKPTESLGSDFNAYFDHLVSEDQLGVVAATKPIKYCYLLPYKKQFVLNPALLAHCPQHIQLSDGVEKCFLGIIVSKEVNTKDGVDSSSPDAAAAKASKMSTPSTSKREKKRFPSSSSSPSSAKRTRRSCATPQNSQEEEGDSD